MREIENRNNDVIMGGESSGRICHENSCSAGQRDAGADRNKSSGQRRGPRTIKNEWGRPENPLSACFSWVGTNHERGLSVIPKPPDSPGFEIRHFHHELGRPGQLEARAMGRHAVSCAAQPAPGPGTPL